MFADAFAAFTTADTYSTFAAEIGAAQTRLIPIFLFPTTGAPSYAPPTGYFITNTAWSGAGWIGMRQSYFDSDAKTLGHEMGHAIAAGAGFFNYVDGTHGALENQRLNAEPTPGDAMTAADQQVSFNEGFADYFAIAGATSEDVSMLRALPGFHDDQLHTLVRYSFDTIGGGGEDEELSVGKILWNLESDPIYAGATPLASAKNVINAVRTSVDECGCVTLYDVWQHVTDAITDNTVFNRLARIFENQNVTPQPNLSNGATAITNGGATFDFYLPLTSGQIDETPFTFSEVTITVYDDSFGPSCILFSQEFILDTVTVWDNGVAYLVRPDNDNGGLPTGLTERPDRPGAGS